MIKKSLKKDFRILQGGYLRESYSWKLEERRLEAKVYKDRTLLKAAKLKEIQLEDSLARIACSHQEVLRQLTAKEDELKRMTQNMKDLQERHLEQELSSIRNSSPESPMPAGKSSSSILFKNNNYNSWCQAKENRSY
jgi:ABC-type phosphate transport system auxiliary subunit